MSHDALYRNDSEPSVNLKFPMRHEADTVMADMVQAQQMGRHTLLHSNMTEDCDAERTD